MMEPSAPRPLFEVQKLFEEAGTLRHLPKFALEEELWGESNSVVEGQLIWWVSDAGWSESVILTRRDCRTLRRSQISIFLPCIGSIVITSWTSSPAVSVNLRTGHAQGDCKLLTALATIKEVLLNVVQNVEPDAALTRTLLATKS